MIAILAFVILSGSYAQLNLPEDSRLNYTELATKYGQRTLEYDITTEDGYILKLFRMVGDSDRPVLLVHGSLDTSDDFLLRGKRSLAIMIARRGYDVWAINHRGNRYSRRHSTLNPDTDKVYWDFSMTEFGRVDLPTAIDFIQKRTRAKINVIGYSEGATSTVVMGALRPEYNEKVQVFIAIAPVCYLHNAKQFLSTVIDLAPHFNKGLRSTSSEEFLGFDSPLRSFLTKICSLNVGYVICAMLGIFPISGYNERELEPSFLPVLMGHFPGGTSRKNLNHFAQISRRKEFADYDYGARKNLAVYGRIEPPVFQIKKVTMKVVIITAKNDRISTMEDVRLLRKELPNVVKNIVLKRPDFAHLDFVMGRTSHKVVVPEILDILEQFNQK